MRFIIISSVFVYLITANAIIQPTTKDFSEFEYLNCTSQNHTNNNSALILNGVKFYNHTRFTYNILEPDLCRGRVEIVIYVQTALPHFEKRNVIRQTFGSLLAINSKRAVLLFVVGIHPDDKYTQKKLLAESSQYHDIVQANFVDSYRNLTRKHLVMLDWIRNHCSHAEFISKTDDDVFVNPFALAATLYDPVFNRTEPYVLGDIYPNEFPIRFLSKWAVSENEYPYHLRKYPPYLKGYAYILSRASIGPLWFCSYFRPYLFIDDVFITGLVLVSTHGYVKLYSLNQIAYRTNFHLTYEGATQEIDNHLFSINNSFNKTLWEAAWKNSLQSSKSYDEFN